MSRGIIVLVGLLVASLVWAYLLVNPFGEGASISSVPVWKVQAREIARLIYRKGPTNIILEPTWEAGRDTPYIWVRSESKARSAQKSPITAPGESTSSRVETFKASPRANGILKKFTNLEAKRGVGELEKLKAADFGLPSLNHTLRLEFTGSREPLILELGDATYGNHMRYAAVSGTGRVVLLLENILRELERARSTLFDRDLFPVAPNLADRISIRRGQKTKDMWRFDGQTEKGIWIYEQGEAEGRPELMEFANALKNLKVQAYLDKGSDPALEASTPELEVLLYHPLAGKTPAWMKLYRQGPKNVIATSSYSRATTRLGPRAARAVLEKGAELLGGS